MGCTSSRSSSSNGQQGNQPVLSHQAKARAAQNALNPIKHSQSALNPDEQTAMVPTHSFQNTSVR